MKKTALFSIFALGLAMVSCEDFDYPNPPAQSNEQLPVLDASGVTVAQTANSQPLDLKALTEAGQTISLGQLSTSGDFDPSLYTFTFGAEMATSEAFSDAKEIDCATTANNTATVLPDDVEAAFKELFNTIAPDEKTAWFRLKAYAQDKETGTKYRIGGEKQFYATQSLSVLPYDPGFTVEEKYYIIGTATGGQIKAEGAIAMVNGGGSPYDDPEFTAFVTVTAEQAAAGYNWAVVPESTMAAGSGVVMAPTVEYVGESTEGFLSDQSSTGNWNTIYTEGTYMITVDVKPNDAGNYEFSYIVALDYLYVNGNGNGWDFSGASTLYTSDYKAYTGYAYLNGDFKIVKALDWDHGDYGGNADGELTNGGDNIPGPDPAGLYWIDANVSKMTYSLTEITTYGIIGSATEAGWDASIAMTPDETYTKWSITAVLTAGEFKFRANDGWDLNQGGLGVDSTPQEPVLETTQNGSNIVISDAGTYDIVLDLSKYPYTCTLTKK